MNHCAVNIFKFFVFYLTSGNNHNSAALSHKCVILTNGFSQQSGDAMTHNTITDFLADRKSITTGTTLPC